MHFRKKLKHIYIYIYNSKRTYITIVQYVYSLLTDRITEHEAYRKGARIWLRHCATIRKVAGSIPDGVIRIFHRHKPSDRTTALGSTQLLREYFLRINAFKC